MDTATRQRWILRHGFTVLVLAFVLGFPTAFAANHRVWLGAHLAAMMAAIFIILVGLSWRHLRLSERQAHIASGTVVYANGYFALLVGLFVGIYNLPGPATAPPGSPPPAAWQGAVLYFSSAVLVVADFVFAGLVAYGLRESTGEEP
jgi:hypothetical protein